MTNHLIQSNFLKNEWDILNDPDRFAELNAAQIKKDEELREERREIEVGVGGLLIWFYGILALSGLILTRHGSIQIESITTRVVIGVTLFVVGFLHLKKNLKKRLYKTMDFLP